MAMTMKGEVILPASRDTVWEKLNDPETLKASIPGCQELEKIGNTAFRATVKIKVGPVSAQFKGSVELTDLDPPNGYRIVGQGEGGIAGFAKGGARINLSDAPDVSGCLLRYEVEADVGGKIAQLGGRLINGVASKTADQFFSNFAAAVKQ
jgi:carbon monoxide dehydrogenase subunit G